ncbi:MAG: N-acetylmuramoyl-L-alanine amidase [Dysgonamonadaceae bacterium]|jgi:N-acetylmuramoyl-L-alanine amidase|nr:N-acetylmuramoyl-L-alanine amidase [Dysgonamonadaceae bacterium]
MKLKLLFIIIAISFYSYLFSQNTALPRRGEGSLDLLLRNGRSAKDLPAFERMNEGRFGKNKSLLLGVSYKLPDKKGVNSPGSATPSQRGGKKIGSIHKEPLFGKKYESYSIETNQLAGACFYLVSGHGGPDPGAVVKMDGKELSEDEYAYDVMLRLARNLMQHGATVHIIIQDATDGIRDERYLKNNKTETCMGEKIPLNNVKRLDQRVNKINALTRKAKEKYQRALFIHLDSQGKKKQLDVYFYHQQRKESERLAETMKMTFRQQYKKHQPNRPFSGTVSYRNLHVLRNSRPAAVFAELANMVNEFDTKRFLDVNNRQAVANWMLKAFVSDYAGYKQ